jgi:hypothetical protein
MSRTDSASIVEGGQRLVERELNWNRRAIRKGMHELERGIVCMDAFSSRGRKRSEEHLPNLLHDLKAIGLSIVFVNYLDLMTQNRSGN